MAERTPGQADPEEYRGGVAEPDEAKAGTGKLAKGVVPDDVKDDATPPDSSDEQALKNKVLGDFPAGDEPETDMDLTAGDDADATRHGASGGARGSEAGLGRHDPKTVDE